MGYQHQPRLTGGFWFDVLTAFSYPYLYMIHQALQERIETNPAILFGKPVVKGTRISVSVILNLLANGQTAAQVVNAYPELKVEDVHAAMAFASSLADREEREFA